MGRFFVYEEYGAKYESMLLEMTSTSKTIPNFQVYERGIEALAHSLASTSTRTSYSRKGMTFEDLLIKVCQKFSWKLHYLIPRFSAHSTCLQIPIALR